MLTLFPPALAVATSSLPSLLKSAVTTAWGLRPTGKLVAGLKVIRQRSSRPSTRRRRVVGLGLPMRHRRGLANKSISERYHMAILLKGDVTPAAPALGCPVTATWSALKWQWQPPPARRPSTGAVPGR